MKKLFPVTFKSSTGGNKNSQSAALCQWSEVPQHPGLVCCLTHTGGVPVVLMIKPHQILVSKDILGFRQIIINLRGVNVNYGQTVHVAAMDVFHLEQFSCIAECSHGGIFDETI